MDFTECNLAGATFSDCNLERSIFQDSNLEKVDFRTAINYSINPSQNRVAKARFSRQGIHGLLDHLKIRIE